VFSNQVDDLGPCSDCLRSAESRVRTSEPRICNCCPDSRQCFSPLDSFILPSRSGREIHRCAVNDVSAKTSCTRQGESPACLGRLAGRVVYVKPRDQRLPRVPSHTSQSLGGISPPGSEVDRSIKSRDAHLTRVPSPRSDHQVSASPGFRTGNDAGPDIADRAPSGPDGQYLRFRWLSSA